MRAQKAAQAPRERPLKERRQESSEGESGSSGESGMHAGGWESQATDSEGNPVRPSGPAHESTGSLPEESSRPQSPLDVTRPSENYGPGFESESVTEATTAGREPSQPSSPAGGGPAGEATVQSTENNTSVIIVSPTRGNEPVPGRPVVSGGHDPAPGKHGRAVRTVR